MFLPTARKWRPQTFDEVIGQDEVVKALKSAISTGKIGHAYLFSGPRGVGKTTLSRILAKSLNCIHGPTVNPCNKCENCIEIKEGTSVDVIEIDGASNRKIDDVRTIREAVKFVPVKSKYKIYIIDEVHMLTDEAFNALLKTLEEPPQHVVFIFATTEPYKVKQTIRSRCQHFILKPLSIDSIFKQLKKISENEGYKLTEKILTKIAKTGNGSMRDAESIFDMVVSYIGQDIFDEEKVKQINEEEIDNLLGIIDISHIEKILSYISSKNTSELIKIVNTLNHKGFEMKKLTEELIKTFRNLIILKEFGPDKSLLKILDDEIKILEQFKEKFTKDELIFIENVLIETYSELRFTINELFHIENAIFKISNPNNVITISKILEEVKQLKNELNKESPNTTTKNENKTAKIETISEDINKKKI
ncbi:MAG: DNA polymerase III subunit gamma/tau, partial [Brevinematia bacterium]